MSLDDDVVDWFRTAVGDEYRDRSESAITTPRINPIALKIADLETATRFYETVFGFRQVKKPGARAATSRAT